MRHCYHSYGLCEVGSGRRSVKQLFGTAVRRPLHALMIACIASRDLSDAARSLEAFRQTPPVPLTIRQAPSTSARPASTPTLHPQIEAKRCCSGSRKRSAQRSGVFPTRPIVLGEWNAPPSAPPACTVRAVPFRCHVGALRSARDWRRRRLRDCLRLALVQPDSAQVRVHGRSL